MLKELDLELPIWGRNGSVEKDSAQTFTNLHLLSSVQAPPVESQKNQVPG
jgi:hypothetical protein